MPPRSGLLGTPLPYVTARRSYGLIDHAHFNRFALANSIYSRAVFFANPRYTAFPYPNTRFTRYNICSTLRRTFDFIYSINKLKTGCPRQTIIIDACRGYFSKRQRLLEKSMNFSNSVESYGQNISTRQLFDDNLAKTEEGLTVLYATNENQSALDTNLGAAYISSLLTLQLNK
jgi:hypothetical protein